jgi:hypothetical protein
VKVQQCEATDVLTRDGETAVLIDGVALRLSELSSVIYALTEDPVDVDRLALELEARFGAPEGQSSRRATDDVVASLVRHGVLRPVGGAP